MKIEGQGALTKPAWGPHRNRIKIWTISAMSPQSLRPLQGVVERLRSRPQTPRPLTPFPLPSP